MFKVIVFVLVSFFFISGCSTSNKIQNNPKPQVKVKKSIKTTAKPTLNKEYSENSTNQRREKIMLRLMFLENKMLLKKRKRYSQTIDSLMWEDTLQTTSVKRTWHEARDYCKNSYFLDYTNWYLPSSKQLIELYKNKHLLKYKDTSSYWSSNLVKSKTFARKIAFDTYTIGTLINYAKIKYKHKVRCVRDVQ